VSVSESCKCPVCQNTHGGTASYEERFESNGIIKCDLCGSYEIERLIYTTGLSISGEPIKLVQRAALTHIIRQQNDNGKKNFILTRNWLEENVESLKLPSPAQQFSNIVRYIGDMITASGIEIIELPGHFSASVGSFDRRTCAKIVFQLKEDKILDVESAETLHSSYADGKLSSLLRHVDLRLKGWEIYEAEKRGKFSGKYGFIAMDFKNAILGSFVKDVLKPHVKNTLSIDVVDLRDLSQAGIIDNIMRERIRDAKFVLVDLRV
jgi:hypothetical protein